MFEIKNVSKQFESQYALKNINMNIGKGLNFIIGSSGSGKTTLLKILTGIESDFQGEVLYSGKSIKNLSEKDKSYFYNNVFGFIWQDFNLIEDMTVEENIMLPLYLKQNQNKKEVEIVIKKLKIEKLRNEKVKFLSGGQKQRVAIARELIKNPKVIIADEPTSALDSEIAKEVISILKEISKERMVIVVTHDMSIINEGANIYEIDKGELISSPENIKNDLGKVNTQNFKTLKLANSYKIGISNIKSTLSRTLVTCLAIIISSVLLATSLGGAINKTGQKSFEDLYETFGEVVLDINIAGSFIDSSAGGNNEKNEPNANINQDISGLYEKYINDNRVNHILFQQAFNDINVTMNGKKYSIMGSNTVPVANKFMVGGAPKNKGEVVVSEGFVKQLGISLDEAMGKEIDFKASIYNWDSGSPELKDINVKGKIVGVVNTDVKIYDEGKKLEFSIDDSFFFDKYTLDEINKQIGRKNSSYNFVIRPKTPEDMIAIKDELNGKGIVPIGEFKLVEDIVRLNNQTNSQSGSATAIIAVISVIGVGTIALITALMRMREYAIYKICGYSKKELSLVTLTENNVVLVISAGMFLILSPVINYLTKAAFSVNILNTNTLLVSMGMIVLTTLICYVISNIVANKSKPLLILKSGGK